MMFAWLKARWAEVSTKIGLIVGAVATAAPQFATVSLKFAWVGLVAAALLVLWKEKPGG